MKSMVEAETAKETFRTMSAADRQISDRVSNVFVYPGGAGLGEEEA